MVMRVKVTCVIESAVHSQASCANLVQSSCVSFRSICCDNCVACMDPTMMLACTAQGLLLATITHLWKQIHARLLRVLNVHFSRNLSLEQIGFIPWKLGF